MSRDALLFDLQALQSRHFAERGIARATAELAAALERRAPGRVDRYLLHRSLPVPPSAAPLLATGRVAWSPGPALTAGEGAVLHLPSLFELQIPLEELWPTALRHPGVRLAVTLHDLIPMVFPDAYLADPRQRERYLARAQLLRSADLVLAVSEASRQDGIRLLGLRPERVVVIGGGVGERFRPPPVPRDVVARDLARDLPGLRPGFVFSVAAVEFRKNLEGLLAAYGRLPAELRRRHQLVVTCRLWEGDRGRLVQLAGRCGVAPEDLHLTDAVDDDVLLRLYQAAGLFVFPSLYEGFGLPVLEAMACGCPALAGDNSSLVEVLPHGEARFASGDVDATAAAMAHALQDEAAPGRLRVRGLEVAAAFTWDAVADRALAAYDTLERAPARRRRPRIAMVTPLPPLRSGVAVYGSALAARLADDADVDCFVDGDPDAYEAPAHPRCRVRAADDLVLDRALLRYDRVVHAMGNSEYHDYVLRAMARVPGVVMAHDARYAGFYGWRAAHGGPPLDDEVARMYGDRVPEGTGRRGYLTAEEASRAGVWMLHDVLARAQRVLVHSSFAAEVMRLEGALLGIGTPVEVIPFAFPDPDVLPPPRRGFAAEPWIVSFGVVAPIKRDDALVQALPAVLRAVPAARLAFVGPLNRQDEVRLRGLARARGVEDHLTMTGAVDAAEYLAWLGRADVAVQLRAATQGEASLTVAETMAHGIATLVTGMGWTADLPPRAVRALPVDAGPAEIGAAIAGLLRDPAGRAAMGDAARAHARSSTMAVAGERIRAALLA